MAKEQAKAAETPGAALARRWITELEAADKFDERWRDRAKRIIKRYKDERDSSGVSTVTNQRRFAILWSNIQTLGPAVYANTPKAVVLRRFKDEDPVGRSASEVLERSLNYSTDVYDFDERMKLARDDYLLVGRGQAWVRYEPSFKTVRTPVQPEGDGFKDEGGQLHDEAEEDGEGHYIEEQRLDYEEVRCDHISWDDFGTNPARTWSQVRWVYRKAPMDRAALEKRFGEKGKAVPLDYAPDDPTAKDGEKKECLVYEIWDKATKRAIWLCKTWPEDVLDVRDDPLNLREFFPCPRPLMATCAPDSVLPIADYVYYQDQAEELNQLTGKIGRLTDALRLVGMYSGEQSITLDNVLTSGDDNKLIPVADWTSLKEGGGAKGLIEWIPIDMVVETLKAAVEARRQILEDIYQITGISDIIRGASDPNETATAQGIKAQWGSLRVRDRQKEIARFARDIISLKGEIVAEKFDVETLKAMTGVKLPTAMEKQQLQMQMQAAQQPPQPGQPPAQPPPPNAEETLRSPTWEEVEALLKNDALRTFRIDIETDSTIEPDEQAEKQAATEFVTAIGTIIANSMEAVTAAPPLGKLVAESVKFLARRYRAGRELEDVIDSVVDQIAAMPAPQPEQQPAEAPPDPADQQAKVMTAQAKMMDAQVGAQTAQNDAQYDEADMQLRWRQQQLDQQAMARDPRPQVVRNT